MVFNVKLSSMEFPVHYTSLQEIYVSWSVKDGVFIYIYIYIYIFCLHTCGPKAS